MSELPVLVLDASVGVKWFKPESGREQALALVAQAVAGDVRIVAPVHFVHEVLSVVCRHYSQADVVPAWEAIESSGLDIMPLTPSVIAEAAAQCEALGCSFYDSLAPACASLLGATLASADAKAHGSYPELLLIE